MALDLNQIVPSVVRSVCAGAVVLPLALSVSGTLNATSGFLKSQAQSSLSEVATTVSKNEIREDLTRTCFNFLLSNKDSKAEREAKNQIDEYFGGEMNYSEVCKWVYR